MKYCVIGKKLPHTMSPVIHAAFGNENYTAVEIADERALAAFVEKGEYDGFNVTIPFKTAIISMLGGAADKSAEEAGAVNTVVREGGRYAGYNTDVSGMAAALKNGGISLNDKKVMILGSGGTSRTAREVCRRMGAAQTLVVSRTGAINYKNCYEFSDVDVIINTTPVGMFPDAYASPLNLNKFKRLESVFDAIYNPLKTLLCYEAEKLGIRAVNGLGMLVEQARLANNLFADAALKNGYPGASSLKKADAERGAEALRALLDRKRNVVLTGMAGSGKSAIGRILAEITGRDFVDTDEEVEKRAGKSVPEIFKESGEPVFRELEREIIAEVCSGFGRVIATGGGAVTDERNRFYIKSNSIAALIYRAPEALATEGRPLSPDTLAARTLWAERESLYRSFADFTVVNDATPLEAAKKIAEYMSTR